MPVPPPSLRAARRSNPVHTSPENGLPRFLAEPRNDRGRCQACCHCDTQALGASALSDCHPFRGTNRLIREARSAEEIPAGPSTDNASWRRSNPLHTSPENGLPRFLTEFLFY